MRLMAVLMAGFLGFICSSPGLAQQNKEPPKRYGIDADLENYPQADAKSAFASVLKAIDNKKIDYLLAQLSDPQWVDERVQKVHQGKFDEMVKETTQLLTNEPTAVEELHRFLQEGTWDSDDNEARVNLKDVPDRQVFLRKIENRWYLKNDKKGKDKGK
jgi:ribosomal protein L16 Arg81 hydroxylase